MARLQAAKPRGIDPIRRLTYSFSKRIHGRTLEPAAIIAHHRPLLMGWGALGLVEDRFATALDPQLKNLAMLRAAQLVGCEWCLDFGSFLARRAGTDEAKLRELSYWRQSGRFDDRERLVLEYAEAMTRTPAEVSDGLFASLREHFDEREMVELTMAIAIENLYSRSNWAFGLEGEGFSEGAYCVKPESSESLVASGAAR